MDYIINGITGAFQLIIHANPELLRIVGVSLRVSGTALFFAAIVGVAIGFRVGTGTFRGKKAIVILLNTLMALPTVVVGLVGYSFLSRRGLLGDWGLLYTPYAMMIGQFVLATPIIASLTLAAVQAMDRRVSLTARTLGASEPQRNWKILAEARFAVMAAVITGFGRIFAEIGVSSMLGGNIQGYTRNITTAIAYETGKGEFALGIALGIILLVIALGINALFQIRQ
ncbi:MAG TPA: ABC transporter permease subunit [Proteobacteria bacterium]|nr:ABC transporter permease subunit [Pseudomonadota bacterium]